MFCSSLILLFFQVDVIVNTTNDKVDLNANPCGKALLKVAGNQLVDECKKIGSLQTGEMTSTGPAKLNCKRVYHVRSSSWDNGNGAPVILIFEQTWFIFKISILTPQFSMFAHD